ncbi:MAG: CPBP family intramembrane metalloprotease [Acidobacteria bacterium]|nr:CPBP family intramembrane metalloprotease [Acidobacteriota bacterium]
MNRTLSLAAALGLWAGLCFAAALYGTWQGFGGRRFAVALAVSSVLLAGQLLFAVGGVPERMARWFSNGRFAAALPFSMIGLCLVYALGTENFTWPHMGLGAAYVLAPGALLWQARERRRPFGAWEDWVAILLLWLPVEFHLLRDLWPYPNPRGTGAMTALFTVNVVIVLFLVARRLDGVGYTIAWGRGWGWAVGVSFVVFAAVAIPLGQAIGFLRFDPSIARLNLLPLSALSIFLFNAWPEELFFRGLMQNLLSRTVQNDDAGWVLTSVIFGLAHINNGVFPNWRYVLLATLAGLAYGRAWRKTGSIFASALVHTLVNTTWHLLFRTL